MIRALLHERGSLLAARRLEWFGPLNSDEQAVLAKVAEGERTVRPRRPVYVRDAETTAPLIVLGGCLREFAIDSEGRTQTVGIRLPGDIIGTDALWAARHAFDTDAFVPARVASASALFTDPRAERLCALARTLSLVEEAMLKDRLRMLGQARTEQRLLHLFLDLNTRQGRLLDGIGDRLWLPFSQTEIGNVTGVTNVYVSKTMTRLRERGAITVDADVITLGNRRAIAEDVDYVDHFERAVETLRVAPHR